MPITKEVATAQGYVFAEFVSADKAERLAVVKAKRIAGVNARIVREKTATGMTFAVWTKQRGRGVRSVTQVETAKKKKVVKAQAEKPEARPLESPPNPRAEAVSKLRSPALKALGLDVKMRILHAMETAWMVIGADALEARLESGVSGDMPASEVIEVVCDAGNVTAFGGDPEINAAFTALPYADKKALGKIAFPQRFYGA